MSGITNTTSKPTISQPIAPVEPSPVDLPQKVVGIASDIMKARETQTPQNEISANCSSAKTENPSETSPVIKESIQKNEQTSVENSSESKKSKEDTNSEASAPPKESIQKSEQNSVKSSSENKKSKEDTDSEASVTSKESIQKNEQNSVESSSIVKSGISQKYSWNDLSKMIDYDGTTKGQKRLTRYGSVVGGSLGIGGVVTGAFKFGSGGDGTSALITGLALTGVSAAVDYFFVQNRPNINYNSPVDLLAAREKAKSDPLKKTIEEHGWENLFRYELVDPKVFEEKFLEMEKSVRPFAGTIFDLCNAKDGLIKSESSKYSIPLNDERMKLFLDDIEGLNVSGILARYPIEFLEKSGVMPEKSFWKNKWIQEVQSLSFSETFQLYEKEAKILEQLGVILEKSFWENKWSQQVQNLSFGEIYKLYETQGKFVDIHSDNALAFLYKGLEQYDESVRVSSTCKHESIRPLFDHEIKSGRTMVSKKREAQIESEAKLRELAKQEVALKKDYLSSLTRDLPKSA